MFNPDIEYIDVESLSEDFKNKYSNWYGEGWNMDLVTRNQKDGKVYIYFENENSDEKMKILMLKPYKIGI